MNSAAISLPERVGKLETRVDGHDRDLGTERRDRAELAREVRELQRVVWRATGAMCAISFVVPIVLKILKF